MNKSIEINELLDRCRSALGARSDYQMAQLLEVNKARISEFRSGKRVPDVYSCTRIAQALSLDPLEVVAMVEAKSAKSEAQRDFWKSFKFSGMHSNFAWLLCGTSAFSGIAWLGGNAEGLLRIMYIM